MNAQKQNKNEKGQINFRFWSCRLPYNYLQDRKKLLDHQH